MSIKHNFCKTSIQLLVSTLRGHHQTIFRTFPREYTNITGEEILFLTQPIFTVSFFFIHSNF